MSASARKRKDKATYAAIKKAKKLPPPRSRVDRDALHAYLWKQTDRLGRVLISQTQLSNDLELHRVTLTRILNEMVAANRLEKIGNAKGGKNIYRIEDPDVWKWKHQSH